MNESMQIGIVRAPVCAFASCQEIHGTLKCHYDPTHPFHQTGAKNAVTAAGNHRQRIGRPILVAYQNRLGVEFNPADPQKPVGFFEGDTRTSVGLQLSAAEALSYRWADHLERAGAQWFIPILQEVAEGQPIDARLVARVAREAARRCHKQQL